MTYDVVFDIRHAPYLWYFPAYGLVFAAVGAVWAWFRRADPKRFRRWMPRVYAGFAVVWSAAVFAGTFPEWLNGRRALREHTARVVEGRVENFVPMPYQGHADERFTAGGVTFSYSDYSMSSAFKNTSSHGGPIRAGLYVRVFYLGNTILRLEVARSGAE